MKKDKTIQINITTSQSKVEKLLKKYKGSTLTKIVNDAMTAYLKKHKL